MTDPLTHDNPYQIGRMAASLIAIADSFDHYEAVNEARLAMKALAGSRCTISAGLRDDLRKASKRRVEA